MRKLVILRGIPGSGKSTWVKENEFEAYTLSSDHIRTLYQAPSLNADGNYTLYDYECEKVWKTLMEMLEARMEHGEFVIVDATNTTKKEIMKYVTLAKEYRYRMYCVDFSDITLEEAKKRNAVREVVSRVPEYVIDKMHKRLQENLIVPSSVELLKPEETDRLMVTPIDLNQFKKIHHIGDIHGCYTALIEYLKDGIKEDEFYIFTGDYIDRGIENAEVINFITSISNKSNILFLEGNHERWLRMWADGKTTHSKEFEDNTKKSLEINNIKQKTCRMFCKKLVQCAFYEYAGKTFFVSHAGVSTIPKNPLFISAKQMIEGVGGYKDVEKVEAAFDRTMPANFYQIHGHRNNNMPIHSSEKNYNLEGQVEFGGSLRCVQVDEEGIHEIETVNTVYNKFDTIKTIDDAIKAFRKDEDIKEKKFGNISSFNFSRKAFENGRWNVRTVTARGLYIDTEKQSIVARGYNKFFNLGEVETTQSMILREKLKFPLKAYVKENGYLGIIGLNKKNGELLITSKSDATGIYAEWFRNLFMKKTTEETRRKMISYITEHDVTFLYEVVDMEHDPHIIDYPESEIYLLDVVKNDLNFKKLGYDKLVLLADELSFKCKALAYEITTWEDFQKWDDMVSKPEYLYKNKHIEGFVIEDAKGFMFKKKLSYYAEWKVLRGLKERILAGNNISYNGLSDFQKSFCDFVRKISSESELSEREKNICSLRKRYKASVANRG